MVLRELVRRSLVVVGVVAVVLLSAGAGRPTVPQRGPEDVAAARAVAVLTGPGRADAQVPADFVDELGYRPARSATGPENPTGGCSAPISLPAAFTEACRAHDLGYDLLRYAARHGAPLGAWAREAVDAQLARDLETACDARSAGAGCHLWAELADVVVGVNSWRQGQGVPVVESAVPYIATVIGLGAVAWAWRRVRGRLATAARSGTARPEMSR